MKIDIKITAWERVEVPEELEAEVLAAIKDEKLMTTEDILKFCEDSGLGEADWELLVESEEYMTVDDNGGASTIEVLEGTDYIYVNGKE